MSHLNKGETFKYKSRKFYSLGQCSVIHLFWSRINAKSCKVSSKVYLHSSAVTSHTDIIYSVLKKYKAQPALLTLFAVKYGLPRLSDEPLTNRLLSDFHSAEGNDSAVQKVNS